MNNPSNAREARRAALRILGRQVGALALAGVAAMLQLAVWPHIPPTPFLFFYPAVLLSAWCCGLGAAAVTMVASATLAGYFFMEPFYSLRIGNAGDALDLGIFGTLSGILAYLVAASRRATRHATRRATIALHRAERASDAKDEILAVVSHDLKNPLHTITFSADMIAALAAQKDVRIGEHATRIRRAAERAARLVADLLDDARVESGSIELQLSRTPMDLLIDEALSPLTAVADARGVRIDVVSETPRWIECDRDRLIRVLSNVLGNAVQYITAGGEVLIRTSTTDGGVRIEVRDTGPGMTPQQLEHACERYWRGRRDVAGTGLGLYISREIALAHGGEMQITSDPKGGTTVTITLPQAQRTWGDAAPPARHERSVITHA